MQFARRRFFPSVWARCANWRRLDEASPGEGWWVYGITDCRQAIDGYGSLPAGADPVLCRDEQH